MKIELQNEIMHDWGHCPTASCKTCDIRSDVLNCGHCIVLHRLFIYFLPDLASGYDVL